MIKELHRKLIQGRQRDVLSQRLFEAIERGMEGRLCSSLLDVGCGDGELGKMVAEKISGDCEVLGLEVAPRSDSRINVQEFGGALLPLPDNSFDVVMLSDVLHHVSSYKGQVKLFLECVRVCRRGVVVKDHLERWLADRMILAAMDWVGNSFYGVASPGTYLNPQSLENLYNVAGVESVVRIAAPLGIHGPGFAWLTERTPWGSELQFVEFLRRVDHP